jgi:hypothetical protein
MAKGSKKVAKAKSQAKVQAAKGEVTPAVEQAEVVTVNQEKFNRAGMEALELSIIGTGKTKVVGTSASSVPGVHPYSRAAA